MEFIDFTNLSSNVTNGTNVIDIIVFVNALTGGFMGLLIYYGIGLVMLISLRAINGIYGTQPTYGQVFIWGGFLMAVVGAFAATFFGQYNILPIWAPFVYLIIMIIGIIMRFNSE